MIALAIIIAIILLLALIRLSLTAEYSESGAFLRLTLGPYPLLVLPEKEKTEKQEIKKRLKKEKKAAKKAAKKAKEPEIEKPGKIQGFLDALPIVVKGLGRLRRKLLVKNLTVRFVSAGEDSAKAALMFGAYNAVLAALIPVLENSLRIRRRDITSSTDFEAENPSIYAKAAISLALWEAVYVFFAILPLFTKGKNTGKEEKKDGKAPDKRTHGNNDAEDQGDDRR